MFEEIVKGAIEQKVKLDDLILLGDKLYICMGCETVSDWWKPGGVCYNCETNGEREQEFDR